jgi:ferritin-like protein
MASESLHESQTVIGDAVVDVHRAIASLMEELEAVDWYNQRVHATSDTALREVLAHNRDEEKEHAVMTLEWLRRRDPVLDGHLRTYLFADGSIVAREEEVEHGGGDGGGSGSGEGSAAGLGIGSLRGVA